MANTTRRPIADRLFEKLAPRESGCIEFMGARLPKGYGVIALGGEFGGVDGAHRVAWKLANGPIPARMDVCHSCDNPPCCNVEHLFLGTRLENVRDMWNKGRGSTPPHPSGQEHPMAVASDTLVRMCRDDYAAGMGAKAIAAKYGLVHTTVWGWVAGKSRVC